MRLLLVTEHYWPEAFLVNDLAAGLRERGHDVTALTALPNYPQGRFFDGYDLLGPYSESRDGICIERVPVVPRGRGEAWRLLLNYGSYAGCASLRAVALGRHWDASIVFQPSPVTTCIPALALRAVTGVPVVLWVQDLWPETISATGLADARWILRSARALSSALYSRCDSVLAQSRAFLPRLTALGVPAERLDYVPNWAPEEFSHATAAPADGEWANGFPVVFAGNLGRVQALDTVLDAAHRLRHRREIHWVFIGDGAVRTWLAEEVARLDLQRTVFLLGRQPQQDMPRFFARAGALLVSLKSDDVMSLTIPSKVQAYLAAGRPILGSLDGEGGRVIAESGAGWASAAGDGSALAGNVLRMQALSEPQRRAMGAKGRSYYAAEFSRRSCLDRFEQALIRAASHARSAR